MHRIELSQVGVVFALGGELLNANWQEIAQHHEVRPLSPDRARYQALEDAGKLLTLTAWIGDELAGYSVSIVDTHLHYSGLTVCIGDALFVAPKHRSNTRLGLDLIRATEREAAGAGASVVVWSVRDGSAMDALLPRISYRKEEVTYVKELTNG